MFRAPVANPRARERQTGNEGRDGSGWVYTPQLPTPGRSFLFHQREPSPPGRPTSGGASLTGNDSSGEVELDDASTEGCRHHAQGRQEATCEHDGPAAKAIHTHAAERAWGMGDSS